MQLDITQQEIYTGSINIGSTHVTLSVSPSTPYLATSHFSWQRVGCKHIPSYFALSITPWLMEPGGSVPHSKRFPNNPYPELDQPNFSY